MTTPHSRKAAIYARAAKASRPTTDAQSVAAPHAEAAAAPPAPARGLSPRAERDVVDTIVESARAGGRFTTLGRALEVAGVAELLRGQGRLTVFAPTDRAFAKLPPGELEALLQDEVRLTRALAGHVVAGNVAAPQVSVPTSALAMNGRELTVTAGPTAFRVNGARLVKPHLRASNGIIRAIDTVLTTR
jgi:uncharacterized surface protein with fasciclin (FAS1) repeats